jgi:hypothetical protein
VVAERLATGRAAAGPPPAVVAERLATGRTAADRRRPTSASRPAVRRWTSLRMPDRRTATGQPAVDTLGTHVVKINRDEM